MQSKIFDFGKRKLNITYTSLDYSREVYAFLINDGELIRNVEYKDNVLYCFVSTTDRLADYTPYYAKALNKRFDDFKGEGKEYLRFLNIELIPTLLSSFEIKKENIIYGGISLGGLHAVYSSFLENEFKTIVGIVSSLWYPGFIDFIKENDLYKKNTSFFLLNGIKEGSNHPSLPLYSAYSKAKEASDILKTKAKYLEFITDEFAHHDHINVRFNLLQGKILEYLEKNKWFIDMNTDFKKNINVLKYIWGI